MKKVWYPVWVGNFDSEIEQVNITVELPEHYCIIYSYYNRIHNEEDILRQSKILQGKKSCSSCSWSTTNVVKKLCGSITI